MYFILLIHLIIIPQQITWSGLFRLQDFFKEAQSCNWHIKLHQFEPDKPYRETFWKIKEEGEHNIILDVKNENIFRALKHVTKQLYTNHYYN